MIEWGDFEAAAPRIAEIFRRRHAATGYLCLLATLRADGSPRISPMEPQLFDGHLVLAGMPGTRKFDDLLRDPRMCLHTATVDSHVPDGDVKLFGRVVDNHDRTLHRQFAEDLFQRTGFDLRTQTFEHFFLTDFTGASAVEIRDHCLDITVWKPGEPEHIVRKE